MEEEVKRAVSYRSLSAHMRDVAKFEYDCERRNELLELSTRYDRMADHLVQSMAVTRH